MLRRLARGALGLRDRLRSTPRPTPGTGGRGLAASAFLLVAVLGTLATTTSETAWARAPLPFIATSATVAVAALPPEGRTTYATIRSGGPFAFEKDGVVFGNRENLLPRYARGYYREYTVPTPRSRDRGARRIVCGGAVRDPDRCYYTDDHYSSFREIVP